MPGWYLASSVQPPAPGQLTVGVAAALAAAPHGPPVHSPGAPALRDANTRSAPNPPDDGNSADGTLSDSGFGASPTDRTNDGTERGQEDQQGT
ncbi:hypothetical protein O9K51_00738 [Purpureocillium lavendulum]|uniref:Uncharacterized protein n=1 Tax=Purpureocillium lavendulum TaxID=1247861 RepID=A0AB34G598_9HYPO|nr:hypothetical protein O9K51_00738 [Purpureocillium lavendulum]